MPRHFSADDAAFTEDDKPIGTAGYIGFAVLFALPLVGLISVLVFAFGSRNENRRNLARAALIFRIALYALLALYFFVPPAADAMRSLPALLSGLASRLLAYLPASA